MHVAFLDASKAIDRVNRHKLITKLAQSYVPKYLLKVICNVYNNQSVCVRCVSTYSEFCPVGNGVNQLSPVQFNDYLDNLSVQLHIKQIGCSLGKTVVNHLIYFCSPLPVMDCRRYLTVVTCAVVNAMLNLKPPNL